MKEIICVKSTPDREAINESNEYFVIFNKPTYKMKNVKGLGVSVPQQIKKYKIVADSIVIDFLAFSFAVIACDKIVMRSESADGWTRKIKLTIEVYNQYKWVENKNKIEKMLKFLTGDYWEVNFSKSDSALISTNNTKNILENDCVCLLSGGVDSLVGGIDLITSKHNPLFVSQIVRGDSEKQINFAKELGFNNHYQWSIGKIYGNEGSTRARSLTFFAFALLSSTCLRNRDGNIEIHVPENGFISLNTPLGGNRIGSLSTKTTHPVYMKYLQDLWNSLGINAKLVLPFKYKTKGEVLEECLNKELLTKLVNESNSCGKYQRHGLKHCGVCVPCLVRRASMLKANISDSPSGDYDRDFHKFKESKDLSSVENSIKEFELYGAEKFVRSSLSFANEIEREKYLGVVSRGIKELKILLNID